MSENPFQVAEASLHMSFPIVAALAGLKEGDTDLLMIGTDQGKPCLVVYGFSETEAANRAEKLKANCNSMPRYMLEAFSRVAELPVQPAVFDVRKGAALS